MKIVIISDTHSHHPELNNLSGDVLIHCGDVCPQFTSDDSDLDSIDRWFAQQQFSLILCIGGNHDQPIQHRLHRQQQVFQNAIYLQDDSFDYHGLKFYGSPWVPDLITMAFYQDDHALYEKWEKIPIDTDILITHTPPHSILDTPSFSNSPLGCPHLMNRIQVIQPQIHCFGHIHESYGREIRNGTEFINASILSRRKLNSPISIEVN